MTVTFSAGPGSMSPNTVPITGSGEACSTYTAPTEVTTDQIHVTAVDNVTGLSGSDSSNVFQIVAPDGNPAAPSHNFHEFLAVAA